MRNSVAQLSSKVLRTSTRQTLSTSILQRGCLSATTRGLSSLSPKRTLPTSRTSLTTQFRDSLNVRQARWNSNETGGLKLWGFEEINAALPSESETDPSHTPILLIDVREPAELISTGIIPTAINIPLASQPDAMYLTADEFETRFGFPKPDVQKDQKLVFYCKAGVRAQAAAQLAVQAGYEPESLGVYFGSWLDWAKNGGRVEKWEGEEF